MADFLCYTPNKGYAMKVACRAVSVLTEHFSGILSGLSGDIHYKGSLKSIIFVSLGARIGVNRPS